MKNSFFHLIFFISLPSLLLLFGCKNNSAPDFEKGKIKIITITEGENTDGYEVQIRGEQQTHVAANDTLFSENLNSGTYKVELLGLPKKCSMMGVNPVTVEIEDSQEATVTFKVNCSALLTEVGTLEVISSTSIINSEETYSFSVNNEEFQIGANDTLLIKNIKIGNYPIDLTNLPSSCSLKSENPPEVTILSDSTITKEIKVFCQTVFDYKFVYQNAKNYNFKSVRFLDPNREMEIVSPEFEYIHKIAASPDGSKIAFSAAEKHTNTYMLYTMNSDGTNLNQITNHQNYPEVLSFSWAPDGKKISFSDNDNLYVINIDTANLIKLVDNGTIHIGGTHWSPDGSKIVFSTYYKNNQNLSDIYIIDSDGSDLTNITNTEKEYYASPSWSPDGPKISFTNRPGDIFIFDIQTSQIINITSEQDGNNRYVDWSPDGSKIAYVKDISIPNEEIRKNIYVMNADGTNPTALTNTKAGVLNQLPKWSPTGKHIIFNRFDFFGKYEPENHILVMNSDGTEVNDMGIEGCCAEWLPLHLTKKSF